jgi:hypothetical protein
MQMLKDNLKPVLIGVFGTLFVVMLSAQAQKILRNKVFKGTVGFSNGELINFYDDTMTPQNDNEDQIGSASSRFEDIHLMGAVKLYHDSVQAGDGNVQMRVWNGQSSGGDAAANDVLVWDATTRELGADTTAAKPFRITWNPSAFGGLWYVKWTHGGTSDADSIMVTGTNYAGTAQIDTLVLTGGGSTGYGTKLFASVTSATAAAVSEAGTQELDVEMFRGIKLADGGNNDIAGVAVGTIADSGGTGQMVILGPVKATVDAASTNATPGAWLIGASGGDAAPFTAAAGDTFVNGNSGNVNAGKLLGYALQSSSADNTVIWVYVDKQ